MGAGRLVWVTTTHRVPAGLLSWPAWEALRAADRVTFTDPDHPLLPHVHAAGVDVELVPPAPPRETARLLLAAAGGAVVVHVGALDGEPEVADALAQELAAAADSGVPAPEVEALVGSWDPPGARLLDIVAVMDELRSPGGCPWDAEQTHESLVGYLLEETYETVEAIETGDLTGLREELGDLLLQVVFHSRIGEEHAEEPWSIDDVAGGIVDKLIGRHPHVFGDVDAPTAAHVEANWEQLKAAEKGRSSAVEGVPLAQPALALAAKLMSRADRAGLDVPLPGGADGDDIGAALLALVAEARRHGVDPEAALRSAARGYADQVRAVEQHRPAGQSRR